MDGKPIQISECLSNNIILNSAIETQQTFTCDQYIIIQSV